MGKIFNKATFVVAITAMVIAVAALFATTVPTSKVGTTFAMGEHVSKFLGTTEAETFSISDKASKGYLDVKPTSSWSVNTAYSWLTKPTSSWLIKPTSTWSVNSSYSELLEPTSSWLNSSN